ncbi:MAG: response regulator transcription factor [Lachnospiraceae bacterium]|nr:response regulator transcription factor [Lachnospiraceae bacterium]
MQNILICDDDRDIVNALKIYLTDPEFTFFEAYNGQEAVETVRREHIDIVLMDIMMPVMDGITAMALIRKTSNIPVIMLTAKSEDNDIILGLNVGADDYITKPFNPMEVKARVRSQLRRYLYLGAGKSGNEQPDGTPGAAGTGGNNSETFIVGGIELDDRAKAVRVDGEPVNLTPKEFDILKLLMSETGKVFSLKEIYSRVWQETPFGNEGTVAVHIRHLREKIEIDPANPRYIKVIFGQGYCMKG